MMMMIMMMMTDTSLYIQILIKVNVTPCYTMKAQKGGVQLQHYSFFNLDSILSGVLTPRPGRITLEKETVATVWTLGGPKCRSGSGRVTSSRTGVRTLNHPARS